MVQYMHCLAVKRCLITRLIKVVYISKLYLLRMGRERRNMYDSAFIVFLLLSAGIDPSVRFYVCCKIIYSDISLILYNWHFSYLVVSAVVST